MSQDDDNSFIPNEATDAAKDIQTVVRALESIGFNPRAIGQTIESNLKKIYGFARERMRTIPNKRSLSENEGLHFVKNAATASQPEIQKMFANLLARAVDPSKDQSTMQQDAQTIAALTPNAAALLCYVVTRVKPDECADIKDLSIQNLTIDELLDAADVLAQARCMHAESNNLRSVSSAHARPPGLEGEYALYFVTRMGQRICEHYGPSRERSSIDDAYRAMCDDEAREEEAREWSDALIADVADGR